MDAPRPSFDWCEVPRTGKPCAGFIPIKCPVADGIEPEHAFSPSMFVERQTQQGRSVGLCVDLMAASASGRRLYATDDWDDWDVRYESLEVAPAGSLGAPLVEVVPSEASVKEFVGLVGGFWKEARNAKLHVAVHCLSGVNTTGFMIVSYLAQHASLAKALDAFAVARRPVPSLPALPGATHRTGPPRPNQARPPGVYSPPLLEALWQRFESAVPSPATWSPPQPPHWHRIATRPLVAKPAVPSFGGGFGGGGGGGDGGGFGGGGGASGEQGPAGESRKRGRDEISGGAGGGAAATGGAAAGGGGGPAAGAPLANLPEAAMVDGSVKPAVALPANWLVVWSKSNKRWYFFDTKRNSSVWELSKVR